jgi:hypothetical protein
MLAPSMSHLGLLLVAPVTAVVLTVVTLLVLRQAV